MSQTNTDFGTTGAHLGTDAEYQAGLIQMGRPRSRGRTRLARVMVWTIITGLIVLNLVNFSTANANRSEGNRLEDMVSTSYNPSFKVRYADLGASVVRAWYNPAITSSPIPMADGVAWPNGSGSSTGTDETESGSGSDTASPGGTGSSSDDTTSGTSKSTGTITTDEGTVLPADASSVPISVTSVAFLSGQQIKTPGSKNSYVEQDYYSAYINGAYYRVSVAIGIPDLDDFLGQQDSNATLATDDPMLISQPTIVGVIPTDGTTKVNPAIPQGWRKYSVKDALTTQLSAFAEAWTINNTVQLKQLTGDGNGDNYYAGLTPGGWEYVKDSTQVIWSYDRNSAGDVVVELQWQAKLPDETADPDDGGDTKIDLTGATQTQRMDVLVDRADTGLPRITAWGPAGTYAALQPKQNALTEQEFNNLPARTDADSDSDGSNN